MLSLATFCSLSLPRQFADAQASVRQRIVSTLCLYPGPVVTLPGATIRAYVSEPQAEELEAEEAWKQLTAERSLSTSAKAEVAWFSELNAVGEGEQCLSALTCWNNPTLGVPHFHCAIGVDGDHITLSFDFPPRAEAGYETRAADGTYPEPTSREMFALSSRRKELAEEYYFTVAEEWAAGLRNTPGAQIVPFPGNAAFISPLATSLRLPLSESTSVTTACDAAEAAAVLWLSWMQGAEKQAQVKTMNTFAHDSKVRPDAMAKMAAQLDARFGGGSGWEIAVADAGPLDIADRGSAMSSAAKSNFDDEERDEASVAMQQLRAQGTTEPGMGL